ncbi:MAG: hypothetical protein IPM47_07050 [Sphingobacteriales bacterium]|nr:MAG: hypothetical protein IPM47_07050 [Sphingobacteriales bacterium]
MRVVNRIFYGDVTTELLKHEEFLGNSPHGFGGCGNDSHLQVMAVFYGKLENPEKISPFSGYDLAA